MDKIDRIKANIIAKALIHNWKKIPYIDKINKDYLLYSYKNNKPLLELILDYKMFNDFPLSQLNIDWQDKELLEYLFRYWNYLEKDDLFIKCKVTFKGLRGESSSEKPLLYFLLKYYSLSNNNYKTLINKYPEKYMEVIDVLIDINSPEYILLFDKRIVELIKNNLDEVFGKYKNMNNVFILLARLMNDKDLISQLCEKYNHKGLENSIMTDTSQVKVDVDNPMKRKEPIDVKLLSEMDQRLLLDFYNTFANNSNREKIKEVCAYIYDSLKVNNEYARLIIQDFLRIKQIDKDFSITFDDSHGSCFFSNTPRSVNFNSKDLVHATIFHEFAHAVHYYNNELALQYDISNKLQYIQSNPGEYKDRYSKFSEELEKIIEGAENIAYEKIENAVNESIQRHMNDQSLKKHLVENSVNEEMYFQKMKKILLNEYRRKYYIYNYPHFGSLCDIFDAIFRGIPHSYFDISGHGVDYFSYDHKCVVEIIADFMSLKCLPDSEMYMEFLKEHLGEELFDIIEKGSYEALGYDTLSKEKGL